MMAADTPEPQLVITGRSRSTPACSSTSASSVGDLRRPLIEESGGGRVQGARHVSALNAGANLGRGAREAFRRARVDDLRGSRLQRLSHAARVGHGLRVEAHREVRRRSLDGPRIRWGGPRSAISASRRRECAHHARRRRAASTRRAAPRTVPRRHRRRSSCDRRCRARPSGARIARAAASYAARRRSGR